MPTKFFNNPTEPTLCYKDNVKKPKQLQQARESFSLDETNFISPHGWVRLYLFWSPPFRLASLRWRRRSLILATIEVSVSSIQERWLLWRRYGIEDDRVGWWKLGLWWTGWAVLLTVIARCEACVEPGTVKQSKIIKLIYNQRSQNEFYQRSQNEFNQSWCGPWSWFYKRHQPDALTSAI